MNLSKSRYDRAVDYIEVSARPLEQALYRFHFEGAPAANVLNKLAHFQNSDGGFGHGLEPDIRLNDSSVIATTLAFQRFRDIAAPADHPMVAKAAAYLLTQYDDKRINWPIIPPNVDDAPHAPWWVHGGDLEHSMSNPRAEIAGYLVEYPQYFPEAMREKVSQSVLNHLLSQPDKMEMHDLLCYIRLSNTTALPEAIKVPLMEKLRRVVNSTVERNPAQWRNYGLPPLGVTSSPESPFAADFKDEIPHNLDLIIETQGSDGTWGPSWTWGQWEETWAQAKQEWTGFITFENLRTLRVFGRIEAGN